MRDRPVILDTATGLTADVIFINPDVGIGVQWHKGWYTTDIPAADVNSGRYQLVSQ